MKEFLADFRVEGCVLDVYVVLQLADRSVTARVRWGQGETPLPYPTKYGNLSFK